jgi:long-chain acyl-CoA synthetase
MDDPGSLYFSSGTTGLAKGIPQSPENLLLAASSLAQAYGFDSFDTQMGILPVYHTALATYGFWPGICVGSNFILCKKFSRGRFWQDIARFRVGFVETVPTILSMLLNPPEDVGALDLSALRFIGSGSSPLPHELQARFEKTFSVLICNKYGLSETAPTHFNPAQRAARRTGSIGKPLPICESRIFDESGQEVAPGEIGEIVIRGANVIKEYYRDPQATAEAFKQGWFHTGDLGSVDAEGWFYIVDRKKDMIIRGGAKIYPSEVDNVLAACPGLAEGVCFGIPDEIYGEALAACVVAKKGSTVTQEDVVGFCRQRLPEHKCPKKIYFSADIPRTTSGKYLRRELSLKYGKN